jgi:hypothetical protein
VNSKPVPGVELIGDRSQLDGERIYLVRLKEYFLFKPVSIACAKYAILYVGCASIRPDVDQFNCEVSVFAGL